MKKLIVPVSAVLLIFVIGYGVTGCSGPDKPADSTNIVTPIPTLGYSIVGTLPHDTIEKLKSLLKTGGRLIIAVPNYQSKDNDIYKLYWAAYDVPRHLYHFTPRSVEMLMQRHGLFILKKKTHVVRFLLHQSVEQQIQKWYCQLDRCRYQWAQIKCKCCF